MNEVQLLPMLVKVAALFVEQMSEKVREVNAPRNIIPSTSISPPVTFAGGAFIDVIISLDSESGAPAAGAYEWGSGIHATRGAKKKYRIEPKNASVLAIPYEGWNPEDAFAMENSPKFAGYGSKGYLFNYVEHPGVEARPYIRPTIEENISMYRQMLSKEFKAEILRGVERVVTIQG